MSTDGEQLSWLERKRNIDRMFYGLVAICLGLALADLAYHKHTYFDLEKIPGFHGLYGFAVFCFAVFAGSLLRRGLMRGEDYYAPEREPTPGGERD